MGYGVIAWLAIGRQRKSPQLAWKEPPPVTMLKPLCGADPETYECLRTFCLQEYPGFQVVFGVSDANDPSVALVKQLQREFPQLDLQIMIERSQHGSNRKVSNLINMMALARHDILVLSDADVRVTPDYLERVVAPLADADVGIVTCAYRGYPGPGPWSLLGSLFINEWFMPSVWVAAVFGSRSFAFGATIAVRREVLSAIGGFNSVADQLADDYRLGEMTRRLGLRTVLSDLMVETCVVETSFAELVRHELRWLRTIRALQPAGYFFCFITFGMPVAALGALLAGGASSAVGMLVITALARVMLHSKVNKLSAVSHLHVLPIRELLSLGLWAWSFATRRVHWRDDRYRVRRDGSAQLVARI
jgi:ceramide glucosyltransferase